MTAAAQPVGLTARQRALKRGFDVLVGAAGLALLGWLVPVLALLARRDTGGTGIFRQVRIGLNGEPFHVLKIRTMRVDRERGTTITARDDPRITELGARLRHWKLDELPQLWNVLRGDMSIVGPRPDVPGYYDRLEGEDRVLLSVRPGITSAAALEFRDEEELLAAADDRAAFNDQVLFPAKVALNREWLASWSLLNDLRCLWRTIALVWIEDRPEASGCGAAPSARRRWFAWPSPPRADSDRRRGIRTRGRL